MEEFIIYEDSNGNQYVKGDIGGGNTVNELSDRTDWLWDYSTLSEEDIMRSCVNTGHKIKFPLQKETYSR